METSLSSGMWAGCVATVYMSLFMLAKARLGLLPALDPIEDIGTVADTFTGAKLSLRGGWIGHFAIGIAWGLVYAVINPVIPGGEPWIKGLVFGAIVWLATMVAFMPMAGEGLFGRRLGVLPVLASLVLHLVFGGALAMAYAY